MQPPKGTNEHHPRKIKKTITFDEYETKLLRRAMQMALPGSNHFRLEKDLRRIIMLAILSFCRGVIKQGRKVEGPMVAELRQETEDEYKARLAGEVPTSKPDPWPNPWDRSRWN